MNKKPPALLLGIDRLLGYQVTRIFWKRQVPVLGIANNINFSICRTRSAEGIVSASDALADTQLFLQKIIAEHSERAVIMPMHRRLCMVAEQSAGSCETVR